MTPRRGPRPDHESRGGAPAADDAGRGHAGEPRRRGGTSQFSADAKDIAVATLQLRQERAANSDGRVYLIVVKATDTAGGTGFGTATVVVPKSSSAADIASVNALADAARSFADANNGNPPAGYFVVGDGPMKGPKQ